MASKRIVTEQYAADALAALGNRTRLRIFKLLVKAGPEGTNIGTLQQRLAIPATTLSHHIVSLTKAGLVEQQRRGREVICTANYNAVNNVLAYVKTECCAGLPSRNEDAA